MLNAISSAVAIMLTGIVIKFIDDLLDEDELSFNSANYIYCLVCILLACLINLKLTAVLFLACYSFGMMDSIFMILPTNVPSWVEILISIFIAIIAAGLALTIWSYLIIGSVQLIDDLFDQKLDLKEGRKNIAVWLGFERAALLFLIFFYSSLIFQPLLSVLVLSSALIISHGNNGRERNA